jgi:hypothetical protein
MTSRFGLPFNCMTDPDEDRNESAGKQPRRNGSHECSRESGCAKGIRRLFGPAVILPCRTNLENILLLNQRRPFHGCYPVPRASLERLLNRLLKNSFALL